MYINLSEIAKRKRNFSALDVSYLSLEHDLVYGSLDFSHSRIFSASMDEHTFINCNFRKVDLSRSCLMYSEFKNCNFSGANFQDVRLNGTKFINCDLSDTVLDPKKEIKGCSNKALRENQFFIHDGWAYGFRSNKSIHVRDPLTGEHIVYKKGETHKAPYFSRCTKTDCHPGLYFCPTLLNLIEYISIVSRIVIVRAKVGTIIQAGDKFRTPEFEVMTYSFDRNILWGEVEGKKILDFIKAEG